LVGLFFYVNVLFIDLILKKGIDTRMLTKKLREHGTMLGKVITILISVRIQIIFDN